MVEGVASSTVLPPRIGRHTVLGYLADGGMAEIFLGREPEGRPVVIKRILPHLARQGNFVSMFIDEARIGSLVHHPNVVEVHELGMAGQDLFLVMEYLAGESVSGILRRSCGRGIRLPFALGAYAIAEACAGLHAAHELRDEHGLPLGLVHRDVSPQNVFVTYDGSIKVLDFGIATAAHRLTRTATGQVKGKFSYMSPEQCRGEELDLRSDIFSLGVLLYELTTQRRLFKRNNELMVLKAVTETPIPRPSREVAGYPPALEAICMKALERERDRRHASALELRQELLAAITAMGGPADPKAALAELMTELFAERIADKKRMLQHMRAGTDLGALPPAEVDPSFELPDVHERSSATPVSMVAPPARSRAPWIAIGLVAVAASAVAIVIALRDPGESTPPVAPAAIPAAPTRFTLHVDSIPSGAAVTLDGKASGTTPVDLPFDAKRTVKLELAHDGYTTLAQELALDRDQKLLLQLSEVAKPAIAPPAPTPAKPPPRAPAKRPPAKAKPDPFKRYD